MPGIIHAMIGHTNDYPSGNSSHDISAILLDHYRELASMSLEEIAGLCYTSQATISRYIKSLGCGTFSEFRANIQEAMEGYQYLNRCMPYEMSENRELPDAYIDFMTDQLRNVGNAYNPEQMDRIVDALHHASTISLYFWAQDASVIQLQYDMVMAGKQATLFSTSDAQVADAKRLKPGSMVLASLQNNIRYSYMLKALATAKANGAKTLAIAPPTTPQIRDLTDFLIDWNCTETAADNMVLNAHVALITMAYRTKYLD